VVLANEAVFYDARKEIAGTTLRRGRSFPVPAVLQHAVNAFAADLRQPVTARGAAGFRVHVGPIGTGEAVVADANSAIRRYLHQYSDKVLAVETEAGGLAQAFHEAAATNPGCRGWLTVRGIADLADAVKDDEFHRLASRNAATVLSALLPYLRSADRR
jgi:adenosylhomocysteine nucleosidase